MTQSFMDECHGKINGTFSATDAAKEVVDVADSEQSYRYLRADLWLGYMNSTGSPAEARAPA